MRKRSVSMRIGTLVVFAMLLAASAAYAASGSRSPASRTGKAAASGLLGQIESSHQLSIAMSPFAPEDFQSKSGTWTGYDVDILKGFAKTLGAKLVINSIPFASSVEAVSTERDDITIDIFITAQRAKVISFSRPMLNYSDTVDVATSNPGVKSATLGALTGKNLGVTTGTSELLEAKKVPNAQITQYDNLQDTLLALGQDRVAAALEPGVDVAWAVKSDPSLHVKVLGAVPSSISPNISLLRGYYGVPKKSNATSFLAALNTYLKKIACKGTEQGIFNKYGMNASVYLKGICSAPNVTSTK